jgi:hypothetical protein
MYTKSNIDTIRAGLDFEVIAEQVRQEQNSALIEKLARQKKWREAQGKKNQGFFTRIFA